MLLNPGSIVVRSEGSPQILSAYAGHAHFWERALSRRQFFRTAAGVTAGALGASLLSPLTPLLYASGGIVLPNPIPGGIQPFGPGTEVFHLFLPGPGAEPSTITDFNGFVGVAHNTGNGTRTDTTTGKTKRLFFDTDMRFMDGHYIGVDGERHGGTFSFF